MQAEVVSLRAQVATLKHHPASGLPPTDWVGQAQRHTESAQSALKRKDWLAAQRELSAGMNDLREATLEQKTGTQQRIAAARSQIAALQTTMGRLQYQADSLWRRVRSSPGGRSL